MLNISELYVLYRDYAKSATEGFSATPQGLYQPVQYILSIGGKATRPVLALAGCQLFSDELKAALPVAFGVEVFHNFSLVHDDIMDASPLRRGLPTVHQKYDNNTAILSGDAMLIIAYQYIGQSPASAFPAIFQAFNDAAIGVCEGQRLDMNFETQTQVAIADYLRMIELKTAVLLQGALKMGALAGGASLDLAAVVGNFGRDLGIAFQLQDDYLDTFGDAAKFGKRIGGDIVQNKKTYLYLRALELAATEPEMLQTLQHWYGQNTATELENTKIQAVTDIFRRLGVQDESRKMMEMYHQRALSHLQTLSQSVANQRIAPLYEIADFLLQREQ